MVVGIAERNNLDGTLIEYGKRDPQYARISGGFDKIKGITFTNLSTNETWLSGNPITTI